MAINIASDSLILFQTIATVSINNNNQIQIKQLSIKKAIIQLLIEQRIMAL